MLLKFGFFPSHNHFYTVIFTIKGENYLMYQGIFDTDFDKYCEDASVGFGKTGIKATFRALKGWPEDYATNPSSIVRFFREHQWPKAN